MRTDLAETNKAGLKTTLVDMLLERQFGRHNSTSHLLKFDVAQNKEWQHTHNFCKHQASMSPIEKFQSMMTRLQVDIHMYV